MGRIRDITGMRFGHLVAICRVEEKCVPGKQSVWRVRCDCGAIVERLLGNLQSKNTTGCGCLHNVSKRLPPYRATYNSIKAAAKYNGRAFLLTFEEFLQLISTGKCTYCDAPLYWAERKAYRDAPRSASNIDRIDSSKDYIPGNCVTCCKFCNQAKMQRSVADFYAWAERLYKNLKEKSFVA
jgi:hypothetical protein